MKQKLHTLKDLEKTWWWNREEIRRNGVREVDWRVVEEAARNYELMRRSSKGKEIAKTYLQLIPDEKRIVHGLWAKWERWPYRIAFNRNQFQENGWTPINENEHRQWNLGLPDKKLVDEFLRQIHLWREIQKIPKPIRNKGKKNRGVSWKLVEVLDRKQNDIGMLNGGERHTATIAKRRAEKYFVEYERALEKWNEGLLSPEVEPEDVENSYATEKDG